MDIVLEAADGRVVGIEVKLAQKVDKNDFKGLDFLEKALGKNVHRGIVLYMADKRLPFSKNKYLVPLPALWEMLYKKSTKLIPIV